MKKKAGTILMVIFALLVVASAEAAMVAEMEPNDSLAGAQGVDGAFSIGANPDIWDSSTVPWVSIAGGGDGTYDYFMVTATAGSEICADIDHTSPANLDTLVGLWKGNGTYVWHNDDGYVDAGSSAICDSFLKYQVTQTGQYIIGVAEYDPKYVKSRPGDGGWGGYGKVLPQDSAYTLQVSVENHPIPIPGAVWLLGSGLVGLVGFRSRQKK